MVGIMPDFVEWREEQINQERGSKLVHYYLRDSLGNSHLAVVGTERSVRHMLYVACNEFLVNCGLDNSGISAFKWRSRREVIDWLSSLIPEKRSSRKNLGSPLTHPSATGMAFDGLSDTGSYQHKQTELGRSLCGHSSDLVWSGVSWTCGKQLRHYQAFCTKGITIAACSFVLIKSIQEPRYLAYLEDMYEDQKSQKKIKVRWFHQNKDFVCKIPPPIPHPSEVFITSYTQVISAECVDDIATVLTPDHYAKCLATLPNSSSAGIKLCFRQLIKNKIKHFDISTLRGYFNQPVLLCLDICRVSGDENEFGQRSTIKRGGSKRIGFVKTSGYANQIKYYKPVSQNLKYDLINSKPHLVKIEGAHGSVAPPFNVGEKIELLCQDSGLRGCWFRCTVLQFAHKRLKVRYDDVENEDGCGCLEEWVPALRTTVPDKLGMRYMGRVNVRPRPLTQNFLENIDLEIGTSVDAWWSDGWWEGVVIGVNNCRDDNVHVYFPGEDMFQICQRKNMRISKDWINNQWVDTKPKLDILSIVSSVSATYKLTSCSILARGAESGSSAIRQMDASLNTQDDVNMQVEDCKTQANIKDTQVNWSDEDMQMEASFTLRNENDSVEIDHELNSRKRCRDDANEEICDTEVGIDDHSS